MENKTSEEDDKEMMGVPENLKVAASDNFHGRGDDEDESQSDDHTCEAGNRSENQVGWGLLSVLKQKRKRSKRGRSVRKRIDTETVKFNHADSLAKKMKLCWINMC